MHLAATISTVLKKRDSLLKKTIVIHPYLFAVYPIFYLAQHNLGAVSYSDIFFPTAAILIISFLFMWLVKLRVQNLYKTGIIGSSFFILFSLYGHVYNLLRSYQGRIGNIDLYLLIIWVILFITSWYLVKGFQGNCHHLTVILNIVSLTLMIFSLINIGTYIVKNPYHYSPKITDPVKSVTKAETAKLPDIYYIILDSYAGAGTLKELYHYDNSKFVNDLKTRGFYIASKSQSNYPMTFLSLASSLNMEYINFLTETMKSRAGDDEEVPIEMIKNNEEMSFLKSKGYKLINFNSGWIGTSDSKNVDVNFELGQVNEFLSVYVNSTALIYFEQKFNFLQNNQRGRILRTFQKLAEIPKIKEPTFTFAHLLVPHGPYIFGAKGEEISVKEIQNITTPKIQQRYYLNQLIYVNQKVTALIDQILSDSNADPIIIIQADHGPDSLWWGTGWGENPTDEILRERFGIINAYHLPNDGQKMLRESLSPVNTFRVIDNYYFGANYELLPDKSYFSTYREAYKFADVTDRLRFDDKSIKQPKPQ